LLCLNNRLFSLTILICCGCTTDPIRYDHAIDAEPDHVPIDVMAVPDAIPRYEKRTRAGNPPQYKVYGKQYIVLPDSKGYEKKGVASWYGTKFHGRKTSNGEVYDMYAMTAAHKTLPIPSYVRVTNLKNRRSAVVRINDRGPFHDNREIDLSYTAAVKLGIQQAGTGFVEVIALEPDTPVMPEYDMIEKKPKRVFRHQEGVLAYLQVGAFNNYFFANQEKEKILAKKIATSRIQISQKREKQVYKVQVGPLYTAQQIDSMNEKLVFLGYRDAELVIERSRYR
jgi:rare lipoprotein A